MRKIWRLPKCIWYHSVKGIPNNSFVHNLWNWKQFVSLNGFKSNLAVVKCGVPQGCLKGCLLFLIYINDFHLVIKYSEVHHFTDGNFWILIVLWGLLTNKLILWPKNLANSLKANNIPLNFGFYFTQETTWQWFEN